MAQIELRLTSEEARVIQHHLDTVDMLAQECRASGDTMEVEKLEHLLGVILTRLDGGGMLLRFESSDEEHVRVMEGMVAGNTLDKVAAGMVQKEDVALRSQGLALQATMRRLNTKWKNAGLRSFFVA